MAAAGPRKAAMLVGAKRYFTGIPCIRGHVAERFVSTKACTECAGYFKSEWAKLNMPRIVEVGKRWRDANPDKCVVRRRRAYLKNQAAFFANAKARKLSQQQRTPAWADRMSIRAIYVEARRLRESGSDVVVDHVIPLHGEAVSGLHVHANLQILDARANNVKSNTFSGVN